MDADQLWTHVVSALELQAHNRRNWFDPVRPLKFDGKVLTVNATSSFGAYWLAKHYQRQMNECIGAKIPGTSVAVVHKPLSLRG